MRDKRLPIGPSKGRAGFTLIEMMVACAVSLIIAVSISSLFVSLCHLGSRAGMELEGALQLTAARQRMLCHLMTSSTRKEPYWLLEATNIVMSSKELVAQFKDGKNFPKNSEDKGATIDAYLDKQSGLTYKKKGSSLQYIYLKASPRKDITCYTRVVVPVGMRTNTWSEVKSAYR